jgi:hypothetical protein
MPASPPADTHEWVSFDDPDEERTWLFDVTFLMSKWTCIFGNGCQGVLTGPAEELVQGCCSYGAHFTDEADVARVEAAAETLTAEHWQFIEEGRTKSGKLKVIKVNKDGDTVSRQADGACIFLNRPGFANGPGCALPRPQAQRLLAAPPPSRGRGGRGGARRVSDHPMGSQALGRGRRGVSLVVHRSTGSVRRPSLGLRDHA